jgi:ATP-dependent DNA ligase
MLQRTLPAGFIAPCLPTKTEPTVFAHACKTGLKGIVSKRKDSASRSGRSPDWLKMKNSAAPAVKREAERSGQRQMAASSTRQRLR